VRIFRFIAAKKAEHSIQIMCRVLRVSRSGPPYGRASATTAARLQHRAPRPSPTSRHQHSIGSPHGQLLQPPVESGQYTSLIFTRRCRSVGIDVSMGSRGDCFDNAVLESFHASLKKDLIHRQAWPTKAEARTALFDYIETFYNRRRRHSTLGMLSPLEFENGTLRPAGASLAASRLASINTMNYKSTSTAQAA
jgi:transposase InsO family protein